MIAGKNMDMTLLHNVPHLFRCLKTIKSQHILHAVFPCFGLEFLFQFTASHHMNTDFSGKATVSGFAFLLQCL